MKENYTDRIERFFIQSILALLEEKGMSYREFALRVWPDVPEKTAIGKFRLMRNPTDGKYQNITIEAASRMAETLGAELCFLLAVAKSDAIRAQEED
jgi:hypothetical protein